MSAKVIAPFYANVDTRFAGSTVKYGQGVVDGHRAFAVNWLNVDYAASSPSHTNRDSFQLVLIDRSDLGAGNFDMEFNYDQVNWESGGGTGVGGSSTASAGRPTTAPSRARTRWPAPTSPAPSSTATPDRPGPSQLHERRGRPLRLSLPRRHLGRRARHRLGQHRPRREPARRSRLEESGYGTAYLDLAGSFDDPDADLWSATVDYGDGFGEQVLQLNDDHSFSLSIRSSTTSPTPSPSP